VTSGARFVGQRVARQEDVRFLTGRGRFVDDISVPRTLHAAFARSDVAKGTIASVDTTAAAAMAGVIAVFVASFVTRSVDWRGARLTIGGDGRMTVPTETRSR